jgi:hypothetical protein
VEPLMSVFMMAVTRRVAISSRHRPDPVARTS